MFLQAKFNTWSIDKLQGNGDPIQNVKENKTPK